MAKAGPKKIATYDARFKATAVRLSDLPEVLIQDVAAAPDLSVHGGPEKAVYAYPAEHYSFWRRELPDADLPWDKLAIRFGQPGVVKRFPQSRRSGYYFAGEREG